MIPESRSRNFGHTRNGYAVEFNFAGFACRSLTVETIEEAEMIEESIVLQEGTSGVRLVHDP